MSDADRLLFGWFLALNDQARKSVTVTEVRCPRGCLVASVVAIEKRLCVLALFTATKTKINPLTLRTAPHTRWTIDALRDLTVREFLELREHGLIRVSDFRGLAPERYGVVHPRRVDTPTGLEPGATAVVRCRHIYGALPKVDLANGKKQTVAQIDLGHVARLN